jgi:DNA invertase Pin-like site-specific DNA recombinase
LVAGADLWRHAQCAASLLRAGLQGLLEDAMVGRIDVVVTEALDHLNRNHPDHRRAVQAAEL